MKGTLAVAGTLIQNSVPEIVAVIKAFIEQGTVEQLAEDAELTEYIVLDHPDFDVENGRYVLVIKDFRDPAAFYNRMHKLYKLERVDADGKHICVKEYK